MTITPLDASPLTHFHSTPRSNVNRNLQSVGARSPTAGEGRLAPTVGEGKMEEDLPVQFLEDFSETFLSFRKVEPLEETSAIL